LSYTGPKIVLYTFLSKIYSEGDYFGNVKKMSLTTICDKEVSDFEITWNETG